MLELRCEDGSGCMAGVRAHAGDAAVRSASSGARWPGTSTSPDSWTRVVMAAETVGCLEFYHPSATRVRPRGQA